VAESYLPEFIKQSLQRHPLVLLGGELLVQRSIRGGMKRFSSKSATQSGPPRFSPGDPWLPSGCAGWSLRGNQLGAVGGWEAGLTRPTRHLGDRCTTGGADDRTWLGDCGWTRGSGAHVGYDHRDELEGYERDQEKVANWVRLGLTS
jgi:hypothetical protein